MKCVDEGRHKGKVIGPYSTKCMRVLYTKRKERNLKPQLSVTMSGWSNYYRPSELYERVEEFTDEPYVPDEEIANESVKLYKRFD